jgi:flavodoxin
MKSLIACDSYFGNTLQVAEALAEELRAAGHDVSVLNLNKEKPDLRKSPAADAGFFGIGGPMRMARMSRRTRTTSGSTPAAASS